MHGSSNTLVARSIASIVLNPSLTGPIRPIERWVSERPRVRALRQESGDAVYGDATRTETLEAAGVGRAGMLIVGSAGMANGADVIRTARTLNPQIRVLARPTGAMRFRDRVAESRAHEAPRAESRAHREPRDAI
jgi:voltage-gated potassium channel Kch